MIPKQRILLMEHLNLRQIHIGKHLRWIGHRISPRRHPLVALSWPSSRRISIFKLHVLENSLRIVQPTTHINVGVCVLFPMFLIHIFYELNLHFLLDSIKTHRLVCGITQLLSLCFYVNVLFLYSFFEAFHIRFDVINILNSLLCIRRSNIAKNLLDFQKLELKFVNLLNETDVFTFEIAKVFRLFNVFKHFTEFVNKFINTLIKSFFYFHQAGSNLIFPISHDV